MKLSKIVSAFFAVLGIGLMLAAMILGFGNRNTQPKASALPEGAALCAEELVQALEAGDYSQVQSLIYGQPELGLSGEPSEETAAMVWTALENSRTYLLAGACYSEGSTIYRDLEVSYLDAAGVADAIPGLTEQLLAQKTAAGDSSALYDETGNLQPEISKSILREATAQALSEGRQMTVTVRLQLMEADGKWWVLPDRGLFTALSGGTV